MNISLPGKKALYSEIILEGISYEHDIHAQKVFEEFKLKYLDQHHDLYVKSDVLLLADALENLCLEMCLEIYELYPPKSISASRLKCELLYNKIFYRTFACNRNEKDANQE